MEDIRDAQKTCSRAGTAYSVFLLLSVVLQSMVMLAALLITELGIPLSIDETWRTVISMLPMYLVGAPICYLIMKDMATDEKPVKQKLPLKSLVAAFFGCISVMYIGNLISLFLMTAVGVVTGKPPFNPLNAVVENLDTWALFFLMVVLAPLFEEFLYRKLLIDRVRRYGDRFAIVMSGVLFGLSHGNFYQFFYAFGLGVIFAYLYIRTGKLRYTIIFHAIINFMGSILTLFVMKHEALMNLYGILMLVAVIAGIVVLIKCRKSIILDQGVEEIPRGKRFKAMFCNVGMILFFVISFGMFLFSELV